MPRAKASRAKLKKATLEAAYAAGRILKRNFLKKPKLREKKGAGWVTETDEAAEERVIRILKRVTPEFSFLAEESAHRDGYEHDPDAPGRWIIDPLDGTTNFVKGFPMFCVSIAAEVKGALQVGAIYHPIYDEMYLAVKGQGSKLNGKPIRVSRTRDIADAVLTTGFAYHRKDTRLKRELSALGRLSRMARAVRRPGSAALDLAYTARGVFDGFWEQGLNPWDTAAGTLLVREAGGRVLNYEGQNFELEMNEILASNHSLQKALVSSLRKD